MTNDGRGADGGEPAPADALAREVAELRRRAAALASVDISGLDAPQATTLHAQLRSTIDRLGVIAARVPSVVEVDGRWTAGGVRTFPEWVARNEGTSVGSARTEAALGRALDDALPGTREAVASGAITLEHAQVLARVAPTSPARLAALASDQPDRNEAFLLEKARRSGVDEYRREVARWAARVDADSADREHRVAAAAQYLTLARRHDGVALQGFLTHDNGELLATALRAVIGIPSADDDRTTEQRRAEGLVGLAARTLDKGLVGAGGQVRPHLNVHVPLETLLSLAAESTGRAAGEAAVEPAQLDDGTPLAPSVLARLACDSEMTRIVFGPESQVLDVGRAQRTYTGQLRRAVIARDRSCRYPGCHAPPQLGEIHHVLEWSCHGHTSVENGILLCWFHHDLVHQRRLRITHRDGEWTFRRSDGSVLVDERRARAETPATGTPPGETSAPGVAAPDAVGRPPGLSGSPPVHRPVAGASLF